jgi:hypothetical protein
MFCCNVHYNIIKKHEPTKHTFQINVMLYVLHAEITIQAFYCNLSM